MNIDDVIDKKIETNKDKRLSIENLVGLALEEISTTKLFEYYVANYENDVRYFLERRISEIYVSKNIISSRGW